MIEIRPTRAILDFKDATRDELKRLDYKLGIWDQYRYTFIAKKDLWGGKIAIPRWLPLSDMQYIADSNEFEYKPNFFNEYDNIEISHKSDSKFIDSEQKKAYLYLWNDWTKKDVNTTLLNLRTGSGKTYITCRFIVDSKVKTLIIVDQLTLLEQWKTSLQQFTTIKEDEILHLKNVDKCKKIINSSDVDTHKVYLTTYKTLMSLIEGDKQGFDKLSKKLRIGIKVFDEAHKEMRALFNIDASADVKFTIYLTATPARTDYKEDKILEFILPFTNSFSNFENLEKFLEVILVSYKTNVTLAETVKAESGKYGFDANLWSKAVLNKPENWNLFSSVMIRLMKNLYKSKKENVKTCLMFKSINSIDKFYDDVVKAFPNLSVGIFARTHKGETITTK